MPRTKRKVGPQRGLGDEVEELRRSKREKPQAGSCENSEAITARAPRFPRTNGSLNFSRPCTLSGDFGAGLTQMAIQRPEGPPQADASSFSSDAVLHVSRKQTKLLNGQTEFSWHMLGQLRPEASTTSTLACSRVCGTKVLALGTSDQVDALRGMLQQRIVGVTMRGLNQQLTSQGALSRIDGAKTPARYNEHSSTVLRMGCPVSSMHGKMTNCELDAVTAHATYILNGILYSRINWAGSYVKHLCLALPDSVKHGHVQALEQALHTVMRHKHYQGRDFFRGVETIQFNREAVSAALNAVTPRTGQEQYVATIDQGTHTTDFGFIHVDGEGVVTVLASVSVRKAGAYITSMFQKALQLLLRGHGLAPAEERAEVLERERILADIDALSARDQGVPEEEMEALLWELKSLRSVVSFETAEAVKVGNREAFIREHGLRMTPNQLRDTLEGPIYERFVKEVLKVKVPGHTQTWCEMVAAKQSEDAPVPVIITGTIAGCGDYLDILERSLMHLNVLPEHGRLCKSAKQAVALGGLKLERVRNSKLNTDIGTMFIQESIGKGKATERGTISVIAKANSPWPEGGFKDAAKTNGVEVEAGQKWQNFPFLSGNLRKDGEFTDVSDDYSVTNCKLLLPADADADGGEAIEYRFHPGADAWLLTYTITLRSGRLVTNEYRIPYMMEVPRPVPAFVEL